MNIVNSVFAFIGVILLLVDVSINGLPNQDYWAVVSIPSPTMCLLSFHSLRVDLYFISYYCTAALVVNPFFYSSPTPGHVISRTRE